ncbi:DUF397 domain-containing protein [Streptomyces sp. NPDC039022]|uniref:DUF397 domain-containing protein n=1 Tax=Streptomyces sp. NPDC039022 TaxID=3157091 RepID=UPI0033C9EC77
MSYHKSSYSNPEHECVEVATNRPHIVAIRDSKRPTGPTLHVPPPPPGRRSSPRSTPPPGKIP